MNSDSVEVRTLHPKELPDHLRQALAAAPDHLCHSEGTIYLSAGDAVLCCADDENGAALMRLLVQSAGLPEKKPDTPALLIQRIISEETFVPDAGLLRRCRINPEEKRCAAVFRACAPLDTDFFLLFQSLAPAEKTDIAVPLDGRTITLVRSMKRQSADELTEYVQAVLGTMESEGITGIRAGIGREADTLADLRRSFREADEALMLGDRYHGRDHVHVFSSLGMERILECIPPEKREEIRHSMFGDFSAGRLSDEMLETARVFFLNDLNLTAASRQLFIHRNTLNYRLDKIRKDFGLDLRSFSDALIFRIVTGIPDEL